jgi:hypothetical protein
VRRQHDDHSRWNSGKEPIMELLLVGLTILVFVLASVEYGVDSRDL